MLKCQIIKLIYISILGILVSQKAIKKYFVYSTDPGGGVNNNKQPVELDINSKKANGNYTYSKSGSNNKVHTYEAKSNYGFNKVKQKKRIGKDKDVWSTTDDPKEYSSKVEYDENTNTVTITLGDGSTKNFKKVNDSWSEENEVSQQASSGQTTEGSAATPGGSGTPSSGANGQDGDQKSTTESDSDKFTELVDAFHKEFKGDQQQVGNLTPYKLKKILEKDDIKQKVTDMIDKEFNIKDAKVDKVEGTGFSGDAQKIKIKIGNGGVSGTAKIQKDTNKKITEDIEILVNLDQRLIKDDGTKTTDGTTDGGQAKPEDKAKDLAKKIAEKIAEAAKKAQEKDDKDTETKTGETGDGTQKTTSTKPPKSS